jgi:hypothetical protein
MRRSDRTRRSTRPHGRPLARALQLAGVVVAVSVFGFWSFGLWSRMADARSRSDAPEVEAGAPQQLAGEAADPGNVYLIGDSLTSTAYNAHGVGKGAPEELTITAWPGWTAGEAQPALEFANAQMHIDTLVVALGTNDSTFAWGHDGWNDADVDRFRLILATPPPEACVVVVLPGYGTGIDQTHAVEMGKARHDLTALAAERREDPANGPTVVVDWQSQVSARPQLLGPDGIHLVNDPSIGWPTAESAAARTGLYWHGVAQCADG